MGGQQLNYLNLTITLRAYQNVLRPEFAIYGKTTFSGISVNSRSSPQTCSDHLQEASGDELKEIENIAHINNGLSVDVRNFVKPKRLHQLLAETRPLRLSHHYSIY